MNMHPDIDKEKQNIARRYFFTKFYTEKVSTLVSLLALILIIIFGTSTQLSFTIKNITSNTLLYRTIYFIIFYTFFFILSFPFSYMNTYRTEHIYKFSNQNFKEWFIDQLKNYAVSIVLGLIIVNIFYFIVNHSPNFWWFWTGLALLIFSVILQYLAPILLIPIFYKSEPVEDSILCEKLLNLAEKSKIKVIEVYKIKLSQKTKKANAALSGIGSTRRMLLGDTLLDNYDHGEIETVMAHELAHHIHKHIPKLIVFGGVMTISGAYILHIILPSILNYLNLGKLHDIASFPGLILITGIFSFIAGPVNSYLSRLLETQADDTAIKLSKKPDKFISTMVKFANNYLSFAYPPKWIELLEYDHPPIGKRVQRAQQLN